MLHGVKCAVLALAIMQGTSVASAAPLEAIYIHGGSHAAVMRRTRANPNGRQTQEKITVAETLRAHTADNAWEGKVRVLKTGALADFAVLSRDLFSTPPAQIADIKVVRTVVGGRDVFVAH